MKNDKPSAWEILWQLREFYSFLASVIVLAFVCGGFVVWLVMNNK